MSILRHLDPELDAHEHDPERISPRTLNRLRADYEDPRDFESRRFGDEYRQRVKARILGQTTSSAPKAVTTNERFWKAARLA